MDTPKLLRVPEVAKVFNVSRPTIYRMVNAGALEAYSISGSIRIPAEAVQKYLLSNRVGSAPAASTSPPAKAKPAGGPTPEMLAERKAWQIARRMAVKLVPADATDAHWDAALQTAYREARRRIAPAPIEA